MVLRNRPRSQMANALRVELPIRVVDLVGITLQNAHSTLNHSDHLVVVSFFLTVLLCSVQVTLL